MNKKCPLCQNSASFFYEDTQRYYQCKNCHGIFVDAAHLPDAKSEKARYELHDDDAEDAGYRTFVAPITSNIEQDFSAEAKGLDFGAGTSRIITKVMQEKGYAISSYDPYFHPYKELLEQKYDYIASCEVIEHFYHPAKEFALLKSLLKENAKLYLMTDIYDEQVEFSSWYYKNDPTHVFLYTKKTFEWIQKRFEFSNLFIEKRLIILSN
ncbi:methyltransferase domain-containing protein [Sulfurimonas sp. SWIR-19]|uniref:methyltransferase domain-containing protein n=1 Tax=Sulfurimonas sp. SWIR-19 TaxID=2878390 RepID=UPI001CF22793|nr:methyltransferase domain-containing protein [Sulfurimonas sp. SWIR-19]UCN01314.1 methyltransferase domain-containing protein [Sulfurimonas sp. SWIR-19]